MRTEAEQAICWGHEHHPREVTKGFKHNHSRISEMSPACLLILGRALLLFVTQISAFKDSGAAR